jgi:hypothetical protein
VCVVWTVDEYSDSAVRCVEKVAMWIGHVTS